MIFRVHKYFKECTRLELHLLGQRDMYIVVVKEDKKKIEKKIYKSDDPLGIGTT